MFALVQLVQVGEIGRLPAGWDMSSGNWIILGRQSDPQQRALVWFDNNVVDPRVQKFADDPFEVAAVSSRNALSSFLSDRFVGPQRINEVVSDLLLNPPNGRWNGLRKDTDGYQRIWLGPGGVGKNELWKSRFLGLDKHSITLTDDFNRANANLNGSSFSGGTATWVETEGTGWTGSSNQITTTNANLVNTQARSDTELDSDDMYCQFDSISVTHVSGRHNEHGPVCRANNGSPPTNGYRFRVYQTTDQSFGIAIDGIAGGSPIATSTGTDYTTATLRVTANGSSISATADGVTVLGPVTDVVESTGAGNRYCGIYARRSGGSGSSSVFVIDDFTAADIVVATGHPHGKLALLGVG